MPITTPIRPASTTVEQRSQHVRKWLQYTDWADSHPDVSYKDITIQFVREGRLPPEWISLHVDGEFDRAALSDWISNGFRDGVYGHLACGQFALAYHDGVLYRRGDYVATVEEGEWQVSRIMWFRDHGVLPRAVLSETSQTPPLPALTVDLEQCQTPPSQQRIVSEPSSDSSSPASLSSVCSAEGSSRPDLLISQYDDPRGAETNSRDSPALGQLMVLLIYGCAISMGAMVAGHAEGQTGLETAGFSAAVALLLGAFVIRIVTGRALPDPPVRNNGYH